MIAYAIATKPSELGIRTNVQDVPVYAAVYQARPGMKMPIIISRNGKPEVVMAMWGLRSSTAFNFIHMSRVLKSRPWNVMIRRQRCAVPANCVIVQKNEQAYLIRLPQHRLFLMGGVFQQKNDDFHFTLLETESADILDSITKEMPVFIHNDRVIKWLEADDLDRIFHFADKAGTNYFDYFRVSEKILDPNENNRELLIPSGISHEEYLRRQKMVMAASFEKERLNRKNGK